MKRVLKAALVLAGSMASTTLLAQTPSTVRVRNVTYAGSGCPAGSVAESISADRTTILIDFDGMVAQSGPGTPITESRKNCMVSLDLDFPNGWSYTIQSFKQDGYISLASASVTALQRDSYYFQGSSATMPFSTTFNGPIDQDFTVTDSFGVGSQVWSPCGARRNLLMNIETRISDPRHAGGLMTLKSPLNLGRQLRLKWKRC